MLQQEDVHIVLLAGSMLQIRPRINISYHLKNSPN